jgi:hypothetical protein
MEVALVNTFPDREPKAEELPPAKMPPRLSPSSFWTSTSRIRRIATTIKTTRSNMLSIPMDNLETKKVVFNYTRGP